jgi:hypothetical protein
MTFPLAACAAAPAWAQPRDVMSEDDAPPPPEGVVPAPADQVTEAGAYPTVPWLIFQLVPQVGAAFGGADGARVDLRWQVTPLLFTWALDERLTPWHAFVASPIARHGGSIEAHVSPEWAAGLGAAARVGARAYLPLVDRGEYASLSVGGHHMWSQWGEGWGVDAGLYVLYGALGVVGSWTPGAARAPFTLNAHLRFF